MAGSSSSTLLLGAVIDHDAKHGPRDAATRVGPPALDGHAEAAAGGPEEHWQGGGRTLRRGRREEMQSAEKGTKRNKGKEEGEKRRENARRKREEGMTPRRKERGRGRGRKEGSGRKEIARNVREGR